MHNAIRLMTIACLSAPLFLVAQTSNIFEPSYNPVDEVDKQSSRPDFSVALYPGHLCRSGGTLDPGIHVTKQTPPTFLTHTREDKGVPPENSVLFYEACKKHNVPAEIHLYDKGRHGLGLGPKPGARWV